MDALPPSTRAGADRALRVLREAFGDDLRSVALFGSRARGDAREESDYDFAVVVSRRDPDPYARASRAKIRLGIQEPPHLSFVLWSSEELLRHPWLLIDVATDGIVILDDGGLERELSDVRGRLRTYGARRVHLPDGTWYWDLKPDWKPGDVVEI